MNKFANAAVSLVLAAFAAGCDFSGAAERTDRESRKYAEAMAELQAGRIDAAIDGFSSLLREEPGNGNAHFQLAALLEEAKKDYLGAIVHYRMYLLLRPSSDKTAVALNRLHGCETRYSAALAPKHGNGTAAPASVKEPASAAESAARLEKAVEDLEKAKAEIASLKSELQMKNRMLQRFKDSDGDISAADARRRIRPTDAELLDDDSENEGISSSGEISKLKKMIEEDERNAVPPPVSTNAASASNPFVRKDAKQKNAQPVPETYTVEEGDTLMKISAKFYGTNRKWREIRDANRDTISSDGRVKTGQKIRLP